MAFVRTPGVTLYPSLGIPVLEKYIERSSFTLQMQKYEILTGYWFMNE
jgi:hypothetical protein